MKDRLVRVVSEDFHGVKTASRDLLAYIAASWRQEHTRSAEIRNSAERMTPTGDRVAWAAA